MEKKKILAIIIALILIVGIAITATTGLNFDLKFQDANKIELYLKKQFEVQDIKNIATEVLGKKDVMIQKVEVYEDSVSIVSKEITEEQKNEIINKINEKYEIDLSSDNIVITTIPHTRARDFIKPYIIPFGVATAIILVYMAVRYRKLYVWKVIGKTIGILVLAQAVLLSLIAIARIPIGRLTIPMVLAVYMLTLIGITTNFEEKLKIKKSEEVEK